MRKITVFDKEHARRFNQQRKEFLGKFLPPLTEKYGLKTALDAGCGIGFFSDYLVAMGFSVTAFDARPQNIAEARSRYPSVNFVVHNIEDLSVQNLGTYDLVLCLGLLYHLENPFLAIRNLYALTRKIVIVESIVASARSPIAWLVDECEGDDQGLHHVAFIPSEKSIIKMLYRAGFSRVYRVALLPDHEDFRYRPFRGRRRTILVASKLELDSPLLRLLAEPLVGEQQMRRGVLERIVQMHRVNLVFPIYLPGWLYYPLRKLKRALVPHNNCKRTINLLGDRDVEWSWVASQMPSGPGEALDFGPGGSYLGLMAAQRGFNVTAVDLETVHWPYVHPGLRFIQGDILKLPLPKEHFDLVINCSTVEHVGLAGRYGVTENRRDGDLEAMRRLWDLMKPGGLMLLTIPVGRDAVFAPLCRVYGRERLPRLLDGYVVEKEAFWVKDQENRWVQTDRETALDFEASAGSWDPLQNVYGLGCFVLRKP